MSKKSLINNLLERRIPQILGSYLVAGTSLILFIEYLVDKYQFPSHYPTLSLFALVGILPSVVILAYFHGAPGKDEWTKVERIGIPTNVLFIAGILFFGDSLNIWEMDNNISDKEIPNVHLIYIGSLEEDINIAKESAVNILSENKGANVSLIDELELKNIRTDLESKLYSEFYNQNLKIEVLNTDEDIHFVDNSIIKYNRMETLAESIYKFFDKPKHIVFVRIYAIKSISGEKLEYTYDVFGALGDGWKNIMRDEGTEKTMEKTKSSILESVISQVKMVKNNFASWHAGEVVKSDGNYVYINPLGLKMKKNMNLFGYREWNLYDKDKDGFADKDSSYFTFLNDVKEGITYTKNTQEYTEERIYLEKRYEWLTHDSLQWLPKDIVSPTHRYSLKVVSVKDSVVIAKLLEINPWTRVNVGDGISLD